MKSILLRGIIFVSFFFLMGSPCFAGGLLDRDRDPAWDQIYNGSGIGFGAVETPTGWQPLMDVSALDLQGKHGFLTFEGRFSLDSADTIGGSRGDGKMNFSQLNFLFGLGSPWLQLGTGIVNVTTDLGRDDITFSVPYQDFDSTRKVAYSSTSAPLLIKIIPLRTDYHYLAASAMVYNFSSAASADIPITLFGLANGTTTVKGDGGVTSYAEVTYNYRLTKDIRKKGWLLYAKGFYETGEAKNLTQFNVPAEFANIGGATASVPDLKWQMQGVFLGISLEL